MSARSAGYSRAAWQHARAAALTRAHRQCQATDWTGRRCARTDHLVVHHRDGQGMRGPRATDHTNLIVLCPSHHHDEHADVKGRGRSHND